MSNCTEACRARIECAVCHKRKQPRGRDIPAEISAGWCSWPCAGYALPPRAPHLFPNEDLPPAGEGCGKPESDPRLAASLARVSRRVANPTNPNGCLYACCNFERCPGFEPPCRALHPSPDYAKHPEDADWRCGLLQGHDEANHEGKWADWPVTP